MIEIINLIGHGFVIMPMLNTAQTTDFFSILEKNVDGVTFDDVARKLSIHSGPLMVMVKAFTVLNWCSYNTQNKIELRATPKLLLKLSEKIPVFYNTSLEDFFQHSTQEQMTSYLEQVEKTSLSDSNEHIIALAPILLSTLLHLHNFMTEDPCIDNFKNNCAPSFWKVVKSILMTYKLLDHNEKLTESGKYLIERAFSLGTLQSYQLMFAKFNILAQGDYSSVFSHTHTQEAHVNRTLNVQASGFQHARYFQAFVKQLHYLFNQEPIEKQPHYIVDTGCGDGSLLKKIYTDITTNTLRKNHLDKYPLTLIGVDYNNAALEETEKTLIGLPHLTLHGDINDPASLIASLKTQGIDPSNCLHVRSFLDHDRPFQPPTNQEILHWRTELYKNDNSIICINQHGKLIEPGIVIQNLVEFLQRWSDIIEKGNLFLLEVHSLPATMIANHADTLENLHFDTYHALSKQFLVTPDIYLLSAAETGLFSNPDSMRAYPELLLVKRIVCHQFVKKPYILRQARHSDINALHNLEKKSSINELLTPLGLIEARLKNYPHGQFVIEKNQQIIAAVYTQPISSSETFANITFEETSRLCNINGNTLQLLGLFVDPEEVLLGLGEQLVKFVCQWATLKGCFNTIVGISRCGKDFTENCSDYHNYVFSQDITELPIDPILKFHAAMGAKVIRLIQGYRKTDTLNQGNGVLICYDLRPLPNQTILETTVSYSKNTLVGLLTDLTQRLIGHDLTTQDINRPFRELGVDSLGLMQLKFLIHEKTLKLIPATFFFEHNSILQAASALAEDKLKTNDYDYSQEKTNTFQKRSIEEAVSIDRDQEHEGAIAIVGMACRFPGATTLEEFWSLLCTGKDNITAMTPERKQLLNIQKNYYGGFIPEIEYFDNEFFNLSDFEAKNMDPQQRLLLMLSVEAFEDAGLPEYKLKNSDTAVFIGAFAQEYENLITRFGQEKIDIFGIMGNSSAILSNRISYYYDLHGSSMTINTACSSSLVAVHLGIQALRLKESKIALVGGVNILLDMDKTDAFAKAKMLSNDNLCKTFSDVADGYVRAEGAGLIVLKPLKQAIQDKNKIYAIIKGSAVNQDGASNGLTAPNLTAQTAVLQKATSCAKLSPSDISYIEAHGTGTQLGDPVEVAAISNFLSSDKENKRKLPCSIGSVKSNIGHLESAAGIAGLIKVALSLYYKKLPPTIHCNQLNKHFNFDSNYIKIQSSSTTIDTAPFYAGISAFSFGGTNAHVILSNFDSITILPEQNKKEVIAFSAKTKKALCELLLKNVALLPTDISLQNLSYTLLCGRSHYHYRFACIVDRLDELKKECYHQAEKLEHKDASFTSNPPPICFVFSGQGNQWLGMGQALLLHSDLAVLMEEINQTLQLFTGWNVIEQMKNLDEKILENTEIIQPIIFLIQITLFNLWKKLGIEPALVIGHSMGEIAAAYAAKIISLEEACLLITQRGLLVEKSQAKEGRMLLIKADIETTKVLIEKNSNDSLWVSAENSIEWTVISGTLPALAELQDQCKQLKIFTQYLPAQYAFHSPLCNINVENFLYKISSLEYRSSQCMFYSPVTGKSLTQLEASYWVKNITSPVLFKTAIDAICKDFAEGVSFIEISPETILGSFIKPITRKYNQQNSLILSSMRSKQNIYETFKESCVSLYKNGSDINWSLFFSKMENIEVISTPSYAWQNKHFWVNFKKESLFENKNISIQASTFISNKNSFIEKQVSMLWQSILNHEILDPHQNFFTLGANSLTITQALIRLTQQFSIEMTIQDMFDYPTIAKLSQMIKEKLAMQNEELIENS